MRSDEKAEKVFELTGARFKDEVIDNGHPILIDFWAPWCGPCKMMKPILGQVADTFGDEVRVAQVNVDEEPELAEAFGIRGIPTLVLMADGQLLDTVVGVVSANEVVSQVRGKLASAGSRRQTTNG
jgi:thioredoxin 1